MYSHLLILERPLKAKASFCVMVSFLFLRIKNRSFRKLYNILLNTDLLFGVKGLISHMNPYSERAVIFGRSSVRF